MPLFALGGGNMTFAVNGSIWHLSFEKPSSSNLLRSDGVATLGVTDNALKTVFINNRLNQRMTDKVLCHELVHVYSFENGLDIPIETEEIIADFMSLYGRNIVYLADSILSNVLGNTI